MKRKIMGTMAVLVLAVPVGVAADVSISDQVAPAQASTYYWYPAPNNDPWVCYWRGQRSRWVQVFSYVGHIWQAQCRKVITYTPPRLV